jgi:prepilin-type processing-associated H-X9-DG protein
MSFDHNPFHYLRKKAPACNRFAAIGMNNVVFCDGHVKALDYQAFINRLFGTGPLPGENF